MFRGSRSQDTVLTKVEPISSVGMKHSKMGADLGEKEKDPKDQEHHYMEEVLSKDFNTDEQFKHKIVWSIVILLAVLHTCALWGIYHVLFHAKLLTILFELGLAFLTIEGVLLGAHRYYSHKSFKATTPLRVALLIFQAMAGQLSAYRWAKDHRLHHKYSDTDADPHNSKRGFLFCHIGWLVSRRHPLVVEKAKGIDLHDLNTDKLLMFQYRYYLPVYLLFGLAIPICLPVYGWGETFPSAFFLYTLRYVVILHFTLTINSLAHMYGNKPYDKRIASTNSKLSAWLTGGEGWHNFHHAFPWDYRTDEFGVHDGLNTLVLQKLIEYGLAYDPKIASDTVIQGHARRHGDGTRRAT